MIAFNHIELGQRHVSYFNNINQVAKDFKKILFFYSNRELTLFEKKETIKHNHLLHLFSQQFAKSYKQLDKESDRPVNLALIDNLIHKYLSDKLGLKENLVKEISTAFLYSCLYDNLEQKRLYVQAKIRKKLDRLRKLDINQPGNQEVVYAVKDITHYMEIIHKGYYYIWDISYAQSLFNIQTNNQKFWEIKEHLTEYLTINNILKLEGNIEETYFLQKQDPDACVEEHLFVAKISKSYHGGYDMSGMEKSFNDQKKEHRRLKYGDNFMDKVTLDGYDDFNIYINEQIVSLHIDKNDGYLCFANLDKHKEDKTIIIEYVPNLPLITPVSRIDCFMIFGTKVRDAMNMKNFYLPKTDNDHLVIKIYESDDVTSIALYINKVKVSIGEKSIEFPYDELLNENINVFDKLLNKIKRNKNENK